MPELVASSDVLIQNAGGMTCLEAFASGVPVVSRNCIPGHGTDNSVVLDNAGVAFHACHLPTLPDAFEVLTPQRAGELVGAAYAMFGICPTEFLAAEDALPVAIPTQTNPARTPARRRGTTAGHDTSRSGHNTSRPAGSAPRTRAHPHRTRRRVTQGSVAFVLASGLGLQLAPLAAAAGVPGLRTYKPGDSKSSVYVAIRPADSLSASWRSDLAGNVTLAADSELFQSATDRSLVAAARRRGTPVVLLASGVLSRGTRTEATGTALTHNGDIVAMADHHRIGASDQFKAHWSDESLIAPNHVVKSTSVSLKLKGGDYVLIDGRQLTEPELRAALAEVRREAKAAGLTESQLPTAPSSS
jgi:hypothetical protein